MTEPTDIIASLDYAIRKAREDAPHDTLVRLIYLPALQEQRDAALREARE